VTPSSPAVGNGSINYGGTIASGVAHSVNISGKTGGTVTFTGARSPIPIPVFRSRPIRRPRSIFGAASAPVRVASAAFTATGGGTVNVCDENPCNPAATGALVNTLTSTTGTALNVANTTIGGEQIGISEH